MVDAVAESHFEHQDMYEDILFSGRSARDLEVLGFYFETIPFLISSLLLHDHNTGIGENEEREIKLSGG